MHVLLHAGPHKTATTSLQTFFDANREGFRDQGVFVPESYTDDLGQHELAWALLNWDLKILGGKQSRVQPEEWMGNTLRNAADFGCRKVLVSSEDFSLLRKPLWRKVFRDLRKWERKPQDRLRIEVVFSTRPLEHLVQSAYPTLVALGLPKTFEESRDHIRRHFDKTYRMLNSLAKGNRGDVDILRVTYQDDAFVETWMKRVLPEIDTSTFQFRERKVNQRISPSVVERWRQLNVAAKINYDVRFPFHWGKYQTLSSWAALHDLRDRDLETTQST